MITHFSGYPNPIQWESEHIDLSKQLAQFYTKVDSLQTREKKNVGHKFKFNSRNLPYILIQTPYSPQYFSFLNTLTFLLLSNRWCINDHLHIILCFWGPAYFEFWKNCKTNPNFFQKFNVSLAKVFC